MSRPAVSAPPWSPALKNPAENSVTAMGILAADALDARRCSACVRAAQCARQYVQYRLSDYLRNLKCLTGS